MEQVYISEFPQVSIIQLKLFKANGMKISSKVTTDKGLIIWDKKYTLQFTIDHLSFSTDVGHYVAHVKDTADEWLECDDSHVRKSSNVINQ